MTASTNPIFPNQPLFGVAGLSTAVTARSVTGVTDLTRIATDPSVNTNGFRVDSIKCVPNGAIGAATSSNVIRIWIYSGNGNAQLFDEYSISSTTPSATVPANVLSTAYTTFVIPAGYSVWASMHTYAGTQDGYNIELFGGAY